MVSEAALSGKFDLDDLLDQLRLQVVALVQRSLQEDGVVGLLQEDAGVAELIAIVLKPNQGPRRDEGIDIANPGHHVHHAEAIVEAVQRGGRVERQFQCDLQP